MPTGNTFIDRWVDEIRALTAPDRVVVCDGSEAEREALTAEGLASGELIALNQDNLPGCFLHRSATDDVARTEHLTFISTADKDDAGPDQQLDGAATRPCAKLTPLFSGAMAGRTMYVVPFLMGPPGSRFSKVGVEITDSRYVVLNMRIDDAHRRGRARSAGRIRRLHALPALARRPVARAALHRALPRGEHHLVDWVGLRRQRAAGQEVPGAAPGELDGATGGLAGRAHADPRRAGAQTGACTTSTGAFPVGVRQDQPGDAGAARDRCRAGRSGPSATTSPGCGRAATAGSGRSIPRRASSASRPARATRPTPTRSR